MVGEAPEDYTAAVSLQFATPAISHPTQAHSQPQCAMPVFIISQEALHALQSKSHSVCIAPIM